MDRTDLDTAYSDAWWMKRLWDAMFEEKVRHDGVKRDRVTWMDTLWSWYEGTPPVPQHMSGWQKDVTLDVLRMGRANYAKLTVDSKLDRCKLRGFRTADLGDDEAVSEDELPDATETETKARRMMQRARVAINEALLHASVMSEGYIMVGAPDPRTGLPATTAKDPRQCVGITDPLDDTIVLAFMTMHTDTLTKTDHVHMLLPEDPKKPLGKYNVRVYSRPTSSSKKQRLDVTRWTLDEEKTGVHPIPNRGSCVHKVMAQDGLGDFETFLDLLQRINSGIVDRIWTSKLQLFRQRAIQWDPKALEMYGGAVAGDGDGDGDDGETGESGVDPLPTHDNEGNEIDYSELFAADPGTLWKLPIGATIWESTPTDIQGGISAVREDIKEYAGVSRTPLYSLMPDMLQGSAEGAHAAREQHMFKVIGFRDLVTPVVLNACGDMLAGAGVSDAENQDLEAQWGPMQLKSDAQRTSSAVNARAAGVPWQGVMEDYLDADPETVLRYKRMRRRDLLYPAQLPTPIPPEPTIVQQPEQPRATDGADRATAS